MARPELNGLESQSSGWGKQPILVTRWTIYWYKKGMVKMYLSLKLIQVPWSIKTMLDLCLLACLTFIPATYLILDHLNKTKQTNKINQTTTRRTKKTSWKPQFPTAWCFVSLRLLRLTPAFAGNGISEQYHLVWKVSPETTTDRSFFSLPSSVNFCQIQVSLSPSKKTVVRTPRLLWMMWHWWNLCWHLCNFPRCLCSIH